MTPAVHIALFLLACYVVGGIPFGLYTGLIFFKKDIREHGSKNIGATNVWRTFGKPAGSLVWCLDVGKGLLPVLLAKHLYPDLPWVVIGSGFLAIMGHTFSPFLGFKGGKGVATSLGVGFGLSWQGCTAAMVVWILIVKLTGYVSLASIVGTPIGCFLVWYLNRFTLPYGLLCGIIAVFVIVKHKSNIQRLMKGEEPKIAAAKADE